MRHIEVSITKNKAIEILKTAPIFCQIDTKLIEDTLSDDNFRFLHLNIGDTAVIRNSIALVTDGAFKIEKSLGNKNAYLKALDTGGIVGIATLFDEQNQYISTLVAKKDSELLIIDEACIESFIRGSSEFSYSLVKLLCGKIRYLNTRIDTYTKTGAEEKLLEFLSHSVTRISPNGCVEMSMSSLSSALGIGRASLYRAIDSLEEKGIISKKGKKIYLLKEVLL